MREPKDIQIGEYTLAEILERYQHWLNEDCEGWEDMIASLRGASLRGANLEGINIEGINLEGANLEGAYLEGTKLRGANLRGTKLKGTNLEGTNLWGAYLEGTKLRGANLWGANLDDKEKIRKGIKLSEPMIGWKKCKNNVIVKLEIPRGAIVFSINNNKCRTDKAKVLEIIGSDRAYSRYNFFSYYVGDTIEVFNFNCEYNVECAEGIHLFKTKEEAERY